MGQAVHHWSEQKERGSRLAYRLLSLGYRIGGGWLCGVAMYPIVVYCFLTGRQHRRASLAFLQNVYEFDPNHGGMKRAPGAREVFLHFLEFGHSIVHKLEVWIGTIQRSNLDWPNRMLLADRVARAEGGVVIGAHLGNLEMLRGIAAKTPGLKFNALVFHQHARQINSFLTAISPDIEINLISVDSFSPDIAVLLAEKVEKGEFIVIMGDRHPVGARNRVVEIPFMGKKACWPTGPFILASLLNCPVFLTFCVRTDGNNFSVHTEVFEEERIHLPRADREGALHRVIERYAGVLEKWCCEMPFQWFNFYDFWADVSDE